MLEKLKENITFYWIIGSSIVIALLAYLFQRRGEKIQDLVFEVQKAKIDSKLTQLRTKLEKEESSYEEALSRYNALKSRINSSRGDTAGK